MGRGLMSNVLVKDVSKLSISQMIGAMSAALDMTEGQPQGHAVRTCMIGMRLAHGVKLPEEQLAPLFYALLLKDLGCSSNASKVCYLFGADDRTAKCNLKTTDWSSRLKSLKYVAENAAPDASPLRRARQFLSVAAKGPAKARELVQLRCDRGASIALSLQLPDETAFAIRSLDEHWDGRGYPDNLSGDQIPLLARILNLCQTVEVFWALHGLDAARDIAIARKGTWFDPELVDAILPIFDDEGFWAQVGADDAVAQLECFEPEDRILDADDATLDRVALGFSQVIDAKSPWTFCHSTGVAEVAVGIGKVLGFSGELLKQVRRAALLHDIGKLGVSNLILDKPGKLTPEELAEMRKHPMYTHQILSRVNGFSQFSELAASHHERLDGRGYHRGLPGDMLPVAVRTLVVSDMYEALAAKRPYRQDLSEGEVLTILEKDAGKGICPRVLEALKGFLAESNFVPYRVAA
jgi:HD-GYP domain-containing protein (c-di-GMP phosphodiesterase class II)